jgi:hypothetical protein
VRLTAALRAWRLAGQKDKTTVECLAVWTASSTAEKKAAQKALWWAACWAGHLAAPKDVSKAAPSADKRVGL